MGAMASPYDARRYLTNFDTHRVPNILTDVLVIGSGIAGLRAAIGCAEFADVIVACKAEPEESNTFYAQGGIAAAMGSPDSPELHMQDTLAVGGGLCDGAAVEVLVREGPVELRRLIEWGLPADRVGGDLALGLEGGHSHSRVIHAAGDATGRQVIGAMLPRLRGGARARIFDHCFVIDLVTDGGACRGAITYHPRYGHQMIWAKATVLAAGGCGRIYRETTNPATATADGMAMAWRAGASLRDMEFVQFHPTTLYVAGAIRALISEAVRGEGAYLVNREGRRFMLDVHPQGELAPRDVVSRAIVAEMIRTDATCAYLDLRHLPADPVRQRFPGLCALCAKFDLDPTRDLIPVRPSAHYMVGGVRTDLLGRTGIERLWACGEVASTGVHGANRLASNSLLEGLVFGARVVEDVRAALPALGAGAQPRHLVSAIEHSDRTELDLPDVGNSLRSVMWRNAGIIRHGNRLRETLEILDFWGRYVMDKVLDEPAEWELQNMLSVARLIAGAALVREESRGVHFRADFPEPIDNEWGRHVVQDVAHAARIE